MTDVTVTCPKCNSPNVVWDFTCHTWQNANNVWMSCMNCDSAVEYSCWDDDCDWRYTDLLNKRNPRWEENEKHRPAWLDDGTPLNTFSKSDPRVKNSWDYENENSSTPRAE